MEINLDLNKDEVQMLWVDYNMFGHQLVVHLNPALGKSGKVSSICNGVDGKGVPVPHFWCYYGL